MQIYEKDFFKNSKMKSFDLRTVIFDMDGVLFDTMPNHAHAWMESMNKHGIDFYEEDAYMHEGRTGKGTIEFAIQRQFNRDASEEEINSIYSYKKQIFEKLPVGDVMPGAREFLENIRQNNLKCMIVTGSKQLSSLSRIKTMYSGFFDDESIVSGNDVRIGKPDPEPYLMALKKGNISVNEAIVVENAPLGIRSAKSAGLFVIAVNTGPLSDEVLYEAGADLVFESLVELNEIWKKLYYEKFVDSSNCAGTSDRMHQGQS